MKYLWKVLGIYLAFLAQSIIFEDIKILSCSPDILVVAIIMCSVSAGVLPAALIGGFAGLVADALYGNIFGINILIYMYLAIGVSLAVNDNTDNSPLLMSWVTFSAVAIMEIVLTVFKTLFGYPVTIGFLGANILVKGVFGAIFALAFVVLHQRIKNAKAKVTDSVKEDIA